MNKQDIYTAIRSAADACEFPSISCLRVKGAKGLLDIVDEVLAADPDATVETCKAAIVAHYTEVRAKAARALKRKGSKVKSAVKLVKHDTAELSELRDEAVRALSTEAELAR